MRIKQKPIGMLLINNTLCFLLVLLLTIACAPSQEAIRTSVASTRSAMPITEGPETIEPSPTSYLTRTPLPPTKTESINMPTETGIPSSLFAYESAQSTKSFFESAVELSKNAFFNQKSNPNQLISIPCTVIEIKKENEAVCHWTGSSEKYFIKLSGITRTLIEKEELIIFGFSNGKAYLGESLEEVPSVETKFLDLNTVLKTATSVAATKFVTEYSLELTVTEFRDNLVQWRGVNLKLPCQVVFLDDENKQRMICEWSPYGEYYFVKLVESATDIVIGDQLYVYGIFYQMACDQESSDPESCMPGISFGRYEKRK